MKYDPETPCKIDATFHDWRTVKGRKMLQLIFEVPLDEQGDVLTLLGQPDPMGSKWCMIALKAPEESLGGVTPPLVVHAPAVGDKAGNSQASAERERSSKPKRHFHELSLPEQCALRCEDGRFERFYREHVTDAYDSVTEALRAYLGIHSRAELSTNHIAANRWRQLETDYQQWLTDETHGPSMTRR